MKRTFAIAALILGAAVAMAQTTAPATRPAKLAGNKAVEGLLNAMPKELWPAKDETKLRAEKRQAWLAAHTMRSKVQGPFAATVTKVETVTVEKGLTKVKQLQIHANTQIDAIGGEFVVECPAGDPKVEAKSWVVGENVEISGNFILEAYMHQELDMPLEKTPVTVHLRAASVPSVRKVDTDTARQ